IVDGHERARHRRQGRVAVAELAAQLEEALDLGGQGRRSAGRAAGASTGGARSRAAARLAAAAAVAGAGAARTGARVGPWPGVALLSVEGAGAGEGDEDEEEGAGLSEHGPLVPPGPRKQAGV